MRAKRRFFLLLAVNAGAAAFLVYVGAAGDDTVFAAAPSKQMPPFSLMPIAARSLETASMSIFAAAVPRATAEPSAPMPPRDDGLRLLGVILETGGLPVALLATGDGEPPRRVRVGHDFGKWRVAEIARTQVRLTSEGQSRELHLDSDDGRTLK